jgi:hypothetical protein
VSCKKDKIVASEHTCAPLTVNDVLIGDWQWDSIVITTNGVDSVINSVSGISHFYGDSISYTYGNNQLSSNYFYVIEDSVLTIFYSPTNTNVVNIVTLNNTEFITAFEQVSPLSGIRRDYFHRIH